MQSSRCALLCLLAGACWGCAGDVHIAGDRSALGAVVLIDGKLAARMTEIPAAVAADSVALMWKHDTVGHRALGRALVATEAMVRSPSGQHRFTIVSCKGESLAILMSGGADGNVGVSFAEHRIEGASDKGLAVPIAGERTRRR